ARRWQGEDQELLLIVARKRGD
ncbi:MAG: hypothetical protein JWO74_4739, partial [Solirubrobacterales bacterium]|nr:hypothetical protein [Solirubrobacterales bacterium]